MMMIIITEALAARISSALSSLRGSPHTLHATNPCKSKARAHVSVCLCVCMRARARVCVHRRRIAQHAHGTVPQHQKYDYPPLIVIIRPLS